MTFKNVYLLIFVFHIQIFGTLKLDSLYLHFCILHCLALKERLANNFVMVNL